MTAQLINFVDKILVVGPVYNQTEAILEANKYSAEYDLIIFNGNLCHPFEDVERRIEVMDSCLSGKVIYNLGNYDLMLLKELEESGKHPGIKNWLMKHSNVVIVQMKRQNLIVTCGGITPQMTKGDLSSSLETAFVSQIKSAPWHRWYGGAFGYVISNNPLTQEGPKFYNFSAQIGNIYGENLKVYAQEVNQTGLGKTILLLDTNKNISL